MIDELDDVGIGNQEPTFLWHPPYTSSYGPEAVALYESTGGVLDPYQKLSLDVAMARDPRRVWMCFEVAIILSRQNGKGEILIALELAWLFLFGEKLIIHSAHLFETCREHFLKIQAVIEGNRFLERRILTIREGRGSEEIVVKCKCQKQVHAEYCTGVTPRLKFMTRKGGAARGFTGGKLVMDEAMILDAGMMAAGLPTMSTREDGQVIYTASAGLPVSTQLAKVRQRGMRRNDLSLALLMWEAERPVYDENGRQVGGDDPGDPRTWGKVNPAYGIRISHESIEREMRSFGGPHSPEFWIERLGIGDYPQDDDRWEVISKEAFKNTTDHDAELPTGATCVLAIDTDRGITTLALAAKRQDGKTYLEVIARHRGTGWVIDKLFGDAEDIHRTYGENRLWRRLGRPVIVGLKNSESAELMTALKEHRSKATVEQPTETDYAASCGMLAEGMRMATVVHRGQPSVEAAIGAGRKRVNQEGGWRWDRDVSTDQGPAVTFSLATWGIVKFSKPKGKVW